MRFFSLRKNNTNLNIDDIILIDENYSVFIQMSCLINAVIRIFFKFKASEAQEFLSRLKEMNVEQISNTINILQIFLRPSTDFAIILSTLFKWIRMSYVYILEASLSEAILAHLLFKFDMEEGDNKLSQLVSVAHFFVVNTAWI